MPTDPITPITRLAQLTTLGSANQTSATASLSVDFDQMLSQAFDHLNQVEGAANEAVTRLAAGEEVEIHQVMLTMQEADLAFQMALQVRNKLVEAYQEVMRMQV